MIKNLLASALVATMGLAASAGTVTLWEGSTSFVAWSGNVNVPAAEFANVAAGDRITATITDVTTLVADQNYSTIAFKTNTDGWPLLSGTEYMNPAAGATESYIEISAEAVAELKATGLIVQGDNLTVTKVSLTTAADIDPNVLFEGEATITGWNAAGDVAASKVKAGDILEYTFSEAGAAGGQYLVKGADWANLLGTTKIQPKDLEGGKVQVGVTEEMVANCGGKIFLQGDGGAVLTKVTLIPEGMGDAKDQIAYGVREPGVQVFATLAEGTDKIEVVFTAKPDWAQICNSSWESMTDNEAALSSAENTDGTFSMVFPLTVANVALINEKKEFVVNTGTPVVSVKYVSSSALESIAADAAAPEYYNIQGMRVANPGHGLYIVRQGSKVSKVIL